MHKNSLAEPHSTDAVVTGFLTTGIDESLVHHELQGRMRRTLKRKNCSRQSDRCEAAIIEILEPRSLPSSTSLDDLTKQAADLGVQISALKKEKSDIDATLATRTGLVSTFRPGVSQGKNPAPIETASVKVVSDTAMGNVYSVNGTEAAKTTTVDFPTGSADRTVSIRVKANEFYGGGESAFLLYGTPGAQTQAFAIGATSDGTVYFSQWGDWIPGPKLAVNRWYDITVTVKAGVSTLYVDGSVIGSKAMPINTTTNSTLLLGRTDNNRQLKGQIGEVTVFSRALNAAEVNADMGMLPLSQRQQTITTELTALSTQLAGVQKLLATPASTILTTPSTDALATLTKQEADLKAQISTLNAQSIGTELNTSDVPLGLISAFRPGFSQGKNPAPTATPNVKIVSDSTMGNVYSVSGIEAAKTTTIDFPTGNADRTLSIRVKANEFYAGGESAFLLYGTPGAQAQAFAIGTTSDGTVYFSQWGDWIPGPKLAVNRWYDITVTVKAGVSTLYVDGTAIGSKTMPINTPTNSTLLLGRTDNNRQLKGQIGEVTVFNRALTGAEVINELGRLILEGQRQKDSAAKILSLTSDLANVQNAIGMEKAKALLQDSLSPPQTVSGLSTDTVNIIAQTLVSQTKKSPEIVPGVPFLQPIGIHGTNLTLAVSSPFTGDVVFSDVQSEGFFNRVTVTGSDSGIMHPVTLTFSPANVTGQYHVSLMKSDGNPLSSFPIYWNRECTQLSLGDNVSLWTYEGSQGKAMNEEMQEVMTLSRNPSIVSGSLGQMQQSLLIDALPTLGAPYCTWTPSFQTAFFKAHPEWKDDIIHETAYAKWQSLTSGKYTVTQIYDQLMRDRTDLMSSLSAAYSQYYSMLSDLMQRGLSTLSDIRNGGNDQLLRSNFTGVVGSYAGSIPMSQLSSIGIGIPSADAILHAVSKIWETKCEQLLATKTAEARVAAGQVYQEQLVANGFVRALDGTMVAATDPRARTKLVFFVDNDGRETLLPQTNVTQQTGTSYGLDTTSTTLVASQNTLASSVYESIGLKLTNGEFHGNQDVDINPTKFGEVSFTITQDSMVNLWIKGSLMRSLSLCLKGGSLPENGYETLSKTGISGDSVSLKLTPGHYTLRVQDQTNYINSAFPNYGTTPFAASVGVDIGKYNSSKIEGKISLDGNSEVMPVRMSVAEFDAIGRRLETPEHGLNSNQSIWVVVHGMDSHEDSGGIESVARELSAYGSQVGQVVTINWEDASKAILRSGNDAPWTKGVGEWVASQLIGLGFDAGKINIVGHSHGTYVAFACANKVMQLTNGSQVNAIVALDPAGNVPLLSGFNEEINFSNVSRNSLAIEGSWISGSNKLSGTADNAFQIDSSSTYTPFSEHGLPTTTFASILHNERIHPVQFPSALTLSSIMTPAEQQTSNLPQNISREFYEGIITIDIKTGKDIYGEYLIGVPTSVESGLGCIRIQP